MTRDTENNQAVSDKVVKAAREEAAIWFFRQAHGALKADDRQRFDSWLSASPVHEKAYSETSVFVEGTDQYTRNPEMKAMYGHFLEKQTVQAKTVSSWLSGLFGVRPAFAFGAAAAFLLMVGATFYSLYAPVSYETAVGEQRTVELADGTVMTLNTGTRVSVAYRPGGRSINLKQGQAHFDVVKDEERPFTVEVEDSIVTVLGTAFDVYKKPEGNVLVSLLSGAVKVQQQQQGQILKVADETEPAAQVLLSHAGISPVMRPDRVSVQAWQKRQFVVHDMPLADVVAEINRYTPNKIRLGGEALHDIPVTGVFPTDAVAAVKIIENYFGVYSTEGENGGLVLLSEEENAQQG